MILAGKDNKGEPRQKYADKLAAMDEDQLREQANRYIWLSAYANNNSRSDYHWMCDAVYDELKARDRLVIYNEEYEKLTEHLR